MDTSAAPTTPADRRSSLLPTLLLLAAFLIVAVIFLTNVGSWYLAFKSVHVIFAVVWIGGGLLLTILGLAADRQSDAEGLAVVARQSALVGEKLFAPAGLIVLSMGIAMMINTDWGWNKFWVIFGLIGYAATFINGIAVLGPQSRKLAAQMQSSGATAPETQAAIKRILLLARVDMAVLLLVIVDMVTKPFS
jgi:uncharacterized membrane protein